MDWKKLRLIFKQTYQNVCIKESFIPLSNYLCCCSNMLVLSHTPPLEQVHDPLAQMILPRIYLLFCPSHMALKGCWQVLKQNHICPQGMKIISSLLLFLRYTVCGACFQCLCLWLGSCLFWNTSPFISLYKVVLVPEPPGKNCLDLLWVADCGSHLCFPTYLL